MKRRNFIKSGTGALFASFLPFRLFPASLKNSTVYEIAGDPAAAVKMLFTTLGGISNLINCELSTASVLVKPNLCLPHNDSKGTITSVTLVREICEYLIGEGVGRIIIADHTLQTTDKFETNDIVKYARSKSAISLVLANEQRHYTPQQVNGKALKNTETMKILDRVDYFINLATAKHHTATHVSLSVKNLMGAIWDRKIFHTEVDLDQAIGDLAKTIHPHLNIIDASRVLLDRGPVGPGPLENPGKIYAGNDMLAVDAVVVSDYNFGGRALSAKEVPHLWASYKNGVGEIDLNKINVVQLTV